MITLIITLIITFKVIFYFLAFLGISRPFPSLSRRDHGTGNESLCPVPISRRDGTTTWISRPFPSRGEAYKRVRYLTYIINFTTKAFLYINSDWKFEMENK